jgi:hypothetical protein
MSFLDELSDSDRENIVSLPYRVGLWISQSDTSGGDDSDAEEHQALVNILHGYAGEVFGAETVQHIISETLQKKDSWDIWAKKIEDVPGDCMLAVDALALVVDEKEVSAYRHHLLEIGEAVAVAFREYDSSLSLVEKAKMYGAFANAKLRAMLQKRSYKSFEQFLNVSMAERKTLSTLAHALDEKYY